MSDSNERERIIEILMRARRPEEEITPEVLEENLRWLVHTATPEEKASEALRERVRAIARPQPPRRRPWLARVFSPLPPTGRRALLGALSLAAASVILLLFLLLQAPTSVLARALDAMAKVRTAHCTGWFVSYRFTGTNGRAIPGRMRLEWWYKAPNRYRRWMGPDVPGWAQVPGVLIVDGHRNVFISQSHSVPPLRYAVPYSFLARYLSPLDFFSPDGIIHRAEFEKAAQVTTREGVYRGRRVYNVEVNSPEPEWRGSLRNRWTLTVDPATNLIVRSESRSDWRKNGGAWQTMDRDVLDHFDYNVPVKASLFQTRFPAHMLRSDLKKPGD